MDEQNIPTMTGYQENAGGDFSGRREAELSEVITDSGVKSYKTTPESRKKRVTYDNGNESNEDDVTSCGEKDLLIGPGKHLKAKVEESSKRSIEDRIKPKVVVQVILYLAFVVAFLIVIAKIMLIATKTFSDILSQKSSQQKLRQRINYTMDIIKAFKRNNEGTDSAINTFLPLLNENKKEVNKIELDIIQSAQRTSLSPGLAHLDLSCSNLLEKNPASTSGYYFIKTSSGQLRSVFCKMDGCGSAEGGWMRLAKFNATECPFGLKYKKFNDTEICLVERDDLGCTQLKYSNLDIPYSKVCGRVMGYFAGTPDGFHRQDNRKILHVYDNYVDGIAISSKNDHIWTFAAGHCNCDEEDAPVHPTFVDGDWTCTNPWPECYVPGEICLQKILGKSQKCKENLNMFNKDLMKRNADISVRICRDQIREDEDIAVASVEIYVQ